MTPLLSICVPTCNRADRLRVMLEAILPQVAQHSGRVEFLVSDNASRDNTAAVVKEAGLIGPISYQRNSTNLGVIGNIVKLTTEQAQGEFVWVLGDDDLLLPDALSRVIGAIEAHPELAAIYYNFRCAAFPDDWPQTAMGGYYGAFTSLANAESVGRPISRWHELINPLSSMCTQVYAHTVRRAVWLTYWKGRKLREAYSEVRMTYPHSCMLAETMMDQPSYYVGEPVLTIFDNGQSWSNLQPLISLLRYPELLGFYRKLGLPAPQTRECARAVFDNCEPYLVSVLRGESGPGLTVGSYLRSSWRFIEAWETLIRASHTAGRHRLFNKLTRIVVRLRGVLR